MSDGISNPKAWQDGYSAAEQEQRQRLSGLLEAVGMLLENLDAPDRDVFEGMVRREMRAVGADDV